MARTRKVSREHDTREADMRVASYTPPPLLPMPDPEPGWEFKWLRRAMRGQTDARNMARKAQQGWVMCRAEAYPEIATVIDPLGTASSDYIESGGLILAKIPADIAKGIRNYNNRRAKSQVRAVDNTFFSLKDRGVEVFRDPDSRVVKR